MDTTAGGLSSREISVESYGQGRSREVGGEEKEVKGRL
jgi:hypothetical protein